MTAKISIPANSWTDSTEIGNPGLLAKITGGAVSGIVQSTPWLGDARPR